MEAIIIADTLQDAVYVAAKYGYGVKAIDPRNNYESRSDHQHSYRAIVTERPK